MNEIRFTNPLQWVSHIKRTKTREKSKFKSHTVAKSCKLIKSQIKLMGGDDCLVTSNIPTNTTGFATVKLYGNSVDTGVSIFFKLNGVQKVIQVDKYNDSNSNLYALAKSVEAMRDLDRWGGVQVMDGMFTGFAALPAPDQVSASTMTFYFDGFTTKAAARPLYLDLCKRLHPDNGGSQPDFVEMKRQYEALK